MFGYEKMDKGEKKIAIWFSIVAFIVIFLLPMLGVCLLLSN